MQTCSYTFCHSWKADSWSSTGHRSGENTLTRGFHHTSRPSCFFGNRTIDVVILLSIPSLSISISPLPVSMSSCSVSVCVPFLFYSPKSALFLALSLGFGSPSIKYNYRKLHSWYIFFYIVDKCSDNENIIIVVLKARSVTVWNTMKVCASSVKSLNNIAVP